jgi:hypothetical protein
MRDRSDQWAFAWRIFACGMLFYIAASIWPDAMPVMVYGEMAYQIEAETWALGFMGSSALLAYGVHINGRWRWSPCVRVAALLFMLALFAYLVASAVMAPAGSVVAIFGGLFFIPMIVGFLKTNLRDLRVRWSYGRG